MQPRQELAENHRLQNTKVQEMLPYGHAFKTTYAVCFEAISVGNLVEINKLINEGKNKAVDVFYFAAELGNRLVCSFMIVDKQANKLNEVTHTNNLLISICRNTDDRTRKEMLQFLLNIYDQQNIWKPFTKNHIRAALGDTTVLTSTETDNLGLTCEDYYIGSGSLINPAKESPFQLTNEKVWRYLHGPLNFSALATYIQDYEQTQIDFNFKPSPTEATLAWYFAYYTATGHDMENCVVSTLIKRNMNLFAEGVRVTQPRRVLSLTHYRSFLKTGNYEKLLRSTELFSQHKFDVLRAFIITKKFRKLVKILERYRDFSLNYNAYMLSQQKSASIADYINFQGATLDFCMPALQVWPERAVALCQAFGFNSNSFIRRKLTLALLKLELHAALKQLLDADKKFTLTYDLNVVITIPDSLYEFQTMGLALFDLKTPPSLLEAILARAENRYANAETVKDFEQKIKSYPAQRVQAALARRYKELAIDEPKVETKSTKKVRPAVIETEKKEPVQEPTISADEKALQKIKTCLKDKDVSIKPPLIENTNAQITFEGNKESIKKISDMSRSHEKGVKFNREKISQGILTLTGKKTTVFALLDNNAFIWQLSDCIKIKGPIERSNVDKENNHTSKESKTPIDLQEKAEPFRLSLLRAFCDADQVKVTWNSDKKHFQIEIAIDAPTWVIKGNEIRHSERYIITCTADKIRRDIIQRFLAHFDNYKNLSCVNHDDKEILISFYNDELPDLSVLAQHIHNQFLRWEKTIAAQPKPAAQIGLFAVKPAALPRPNLETRSADALFRQICAELLGINADSGYLKLNRIIEEGIKYEFQFFYNKKTIQKFAIIADLINGCLYRGNGVKIHSDKNPASIYLYATTADMIVVWQHLEKLKPAFREQLALLEEKDKDQKTAPDSMPNANKVVHEPIITPAAAPASPEQQQQQVILQDKKTLELAVKNLTAKKDSHLANNLQLHLQAMDDIYQASLSAIKPVHFYAYLLHATRLFVILSYLSFEEQNTSNIFYQWRNLLRHAHYDLNLSDLHKQLSYITGLLKLQLDTYFPNVKIVRNDLLTDAKYAELRTLLTAPREIKKVRKQKLCDRFKDEYEKIKTESPPSNWQMEAEVMLYSLIDKFAPDSERLFHKQIGHNKVTNKGLASEVIMDNLHLPFNDFVTKLHCKISDTSVSILKPTR